MNPYLRCIWIIPLALPVLFAGCQNRIEDRPTHATAAYYREKIDFKALPTGTRRLYDDVINRKLTGSDARHVQTLLDTAQRKSDSKYVVRYEFQLNHFDQPFDKVFEEGIPILFVAVEKASGRIFHSDILVPEY